MLKLLQSIFGTAKQGSYPESLVNEAIERAVDGTDPWLRSVSGYKKKLRPAVICAIDHVVALVNDFPPPLPVGLGTVEDDDRLKGYFISAKHMKNVFSKDKNLREFLQGSGGDSPQIVTLLAMEKEEKVIFGAELSGDIIIRDVPKLTVSFEGHRLIDPSADETATRRLLMRRAFDHLLSLALKRLSFAKSERKDLEVRRKLLQAKLNLLEREGWGFDSSGTSEKLSVAEVEERLGQLEAQLEAFGGDTSESETWLQIVADVLGKPEEYLLGKSETIFVDRMAIKHNELSDDASALTFTELHNAEGRQLVVLLVSLRSEELRGLSLLQ
jgi:hypothetical protein